jgi:regulator of Ty1 transposition protein 103
LVNDIVQNAKVKKRTEFPDAFSPLMPEACQTAYRSSTPEIQGKIRRVLEVWKQRNVFEGPIVKAIEARLDEVDKSKGSRKPLMGQSLFNSSGSGMPKELESLGPLQSAVTKATLDARPLLDGAQREFDLLNDADTPAPAPPVHAAKLSSLMKTLAAAETSLSASIKARQALIKDMERLLEKNKEVLVKDGDMAAELTKRRSGTETKKKEVEDSIMRGLGSAENSPDAGMDAETYNGRSSSYVDDRPEVEELTPEPEEAVVSAPQGEPGNVGGYSPSAGIIPGFGNIGATSRVRQASSGSLNGGAKRRKMSHEEDAAVPDLGAMGMELLDQGVSGGNALVDLDADVNELLEQERRGR